ncbi:MAG: CoA-binding protein [Thermoplasmataceae archaeon]
MLAALFQPKSVAVVGASNDPMKIGNAILRNLIASGYGGKIFPVNPNLKEVEGIESFPSVSSLSETPDLVVIAISAARSLEVLRECVNRNVPYVILIPGGFSETGEEGRKLEHDIQHEIMNSNTRVIGPNTVGIFLPYSKLNTALTPPDRINFPPAGSIGLITQSGALGLMMLDEAAESGTGLSFFVNLGNRSDLDENELLEYAMSDGRTAGIGIYLESIPNGRSFLDSIRRISKVKPVVILKAGRTKKSSAAAVLHTGAMASDDRIVNGLIAQAGAVRAYNETELMDFIRVLVYSKRAPGNRVAVVTTAGGPGVIASDYITSEREGVSMQLAGLEDSTKDRLRDIVASFGSVENPIDLTADGSDDQFCEVLDILQSDRMVDLIIGFPLPQTPKMSTEIAEKIKRVTDRGQKPIVIGVLGSKLARPLVAEFEKRKIPAYPSVYRVVRAAKALYLYSSHQLGGEAIGL